MRPLPPCRTAVLGCPVDAVAMPEAVARARAAMAGREGLVHVALNTAKLVRMRRDAELAADVRSAGLITADGMGVVLAARLLGRALPGRVTGIDLMAEVLALSAREGFRPYLLGARAEVLSRAVDCLRARHPDLRLAGARHGYFRPAEEPTIVAEINRSGADCLFVGLPTPMKERFMARNRAALVPGFVMGVGGSFDVLAGKVRRAPPAMQRAGLEWLFRMAQEPRRMAGRYVTSNTAFAGLLAAALVRRWAGRPEAEVAG